MSGSSNNNIIIVPLNMQSTSEMLLVSYQVNAFVDDRKIHGLFFLYIKFMCDLEKL